MAEQIQKIRKHSLEVVHKIAEWRNYFLHLYTLVTLKKPGNKLSKQALLTEFDQRNFEVQRARKKHIASALSLPFIVDDGVNYLLKMQEDTSDFLYLENSSQNF